MPLEDRVQFHFSGGVNAVVPPHIVGDDEVQTATNVDFSLQRGGLCARRGSLRVFDITTSTVKQIYRYYNVAANLQASPFYISANNNLYRVSGTAGTATVIKTGGVGDISGFSSYREHAFIAVTSGPNSIKDDGTNVTDWIKQNPGAAPTVAVSTASAVSVVSAYSVAEGTQTATDGTSITALTDASTFRAQINGTVASTNLNTNGSQTIDDYGIDSIRIKFSDPAKVLKISRDYSIEDSSFTNYYHTELDLENDDSAEALPDVDVLIESLGLVGTNTSTQTTVDGELRDNMIADARRQIRAPLTRISGAANVYNTWLVPRTKFELISKDATPSGWANIQAVRIVIECSAPITIQVTEWEIRGAIGYPLNDPDLGYAYWETWGNVDALGQIVSESAPSDTSVRLKIQNGRVLATCSGSPTGSHGLTHRFLYRQGGYLNDAYRVATASLGTGSWASTTFTDTVNDMQALSARFQMVRDILKQVEFPNGVISISEPFYDRLFVGYLNRLIWSLPGKPDTFPRSSEAVVSNAGDEIYGLVVWDPTLVIINRDSVYEMQGNIFEGNIANWSLTRKGSRHGSKAPKLAFKTPYGIPLLDYDGLYMYLPGQGVDQEITWAMEKMADVFRGEFATDPAVRKGSRFPALVRGFIRDSIGAYADGKLYLGMTCGEGATQPNTIFVLDFRAQQVWCYTYPFNFTSMFWDFEYNRLLVGTPDGKVMQIEQGWQDQTTAGSNTNVTWSARTRAWTVPGDAVFENLALDLAGNHVVAKAIVDSTATYTLGTYTNTYRDWFIPAISGTVGNNMVFDFTGTVSTSHNQGVFAVAWDALYEPKRVNFFKTDYTVPNPNGEAIWDVHYADLEILGTDGTSTGTGTVTGLVYVDGTIVMTQTILGPTQGRNVFPFAYPIETFGEVGHTIFRSAQGVLFKLWGVQYDARPEPPRINRYKTDVQSLEEHIFDAWDIDIDPQGTATVTCFVDNTAVATGSFVGTKRQSYTWAIPTSSQEYYGRTIYVEVFGTGFKLYKEWFHKRQEPDRLQVVNTPEQVMPSQHDLRTWVPELNPLGTCIGTLLNDDTVLATATFVGTNRQIFNIGVDVSAAMAVQAGSKLRSCYVASGGGRLKHYETIYESTPKPYGKKTWKVVWSKIGGASQLDMPRFWALDCEPVGTATATVTTVWDIDGTAFSTNTLTFSNGREWRERIPFPPGGRTHLLELRLLSAQDIRVWRASVDMLREGRKGVSFQSYEGTPS